MKKILTELEFELHFKKLLHLNGSEIPTLVDFLEKVSPHFINQITLIAEAFKHPHYRVRMATARALFYMGELFELIESALLRALQDKCQQVVVSTCLTLNHNIQCLSDSLLRAFQAKNFIDLTMPQQRQLDTLDKLMWNSRTYALNGTGLDGENVIFELRRLTANEKVLSIDALLYNLFSCHRLYWVKNSFQEIKKQQIDFILHDLLQPIHHIPEFINTNGLVISCSLKQLVEKLLSFFKPNVKIYSNHFLNSDGLKSYKPLSYTLIDGGILFLDTEFLCFYWVTDED